MIGEDSDKKLYSDGKDELHLLVLKNVNKKYFQNFYFRNQPEKLIFEAKRKKYQEAGTISIPSNLFSLLENSFVSNLLPFPLFFIF